MTSIVHQKFGRAFDEFDVGATYVHHPGRTITEYDNMSFSLLTQNQHPLHIDAAYAAETQFAQRLVVGVLVLSVAVGQTVPDISGLAIANLGYEDVRHAGPTFHGDTLYSATTVLEKRLSTSNPERGIVYVETTTRNQRDETVLTFRRHVLVPRSRPSEEESWAS